MRRIALFVALLIAHVAAIDNGVGLTPTMGWRSWNCYHGDVTQAIMQNVMNSVFTPHFAVNGVSTSLLTLGYTDIGLDDNWQACGTGYMNSFHDQNGNPLINTATFPSMKGMTDYGHSLGLRVGWYMNNCICAENQFTDPNYIALHMQQSAAAVAEYGFDGVKLDGCGQFRNLTWWAQLLNSTGRPIVIENCHWGQTVPGQTSGDAPCTGAGDVSNCPYNYYRTSNDIYNNWSSWFSNLQTVVKFLGNPPLSKPGSWAYPDMLEVGNLPTYNENRAHFAAWCIVSSPLILGFDVTNLNTTEFIWPIISNTELIAVNQDWAGHPGSRVYGNDTNSVYQIWTKPLSGGAAAVFVINNSTSPISPMIMFAQFGMSATSPVTVRDVYNHTNVGSFTGMFTTDSIQSHDSRFYKLSLA